jgi:uncharacterized protein (UPF0333 family)
MGNFVNNLIVRAYLGATTERERGQNSLEYIVIAVVLVGAVAAAFAFLGKSITGVAQNVVCTVTGGAAGCNGG